ncbi:hypothetical protein [Nocardioides sp.]|uniref:hypothetical protein n=1 Tax=Nocardioides sp. TaxID=35761 RepID=UPI002BE87FEE|nr:hypothetical protein [Nocardioides sp.]HXH77577.1 hypothetical protein [Nocardioides sp.]
MTTIPDPDDPDTEGKTVPPYDDRQESADVGGPEETTQDGAHTGGAGRPAESDSPVDDPAQTERGQHASPADEQPAVRGDTASGPGGTSGASHEPGTGRAEDKS